MKIVNKLLIILCATFLLSTQCLAQETFEKPQARLIDEFGNEYPTRTAARLDNFAVEIQNNPSAKGFIISYHSQTELAGKSARNLKGCENYLTESRGIDKNRLIFIEGGEAQNTVTELWIVPFGTTPKIRQDAYKKVFNDKITKKYDSYYFPIEDKNAPVSEYEGCYGFCNDASLGTFASLVKKDNDATAFVILYPEISDRKTVFAKMLQSVRRDLTKKYELPLLKLKIINGGFRRQRSVELWILPKGEHAPVATPNAFPKVRKKRK
ncbi:MAG: hypothetical protein H7Z37_07205 [Pyrinomonadaceae bacterium]|nr:hypothetical protein [Pyrinomonadaceae bacterium]